MGSYMEKPSTLEDAGRKPRRARLGSYGGVGLEKNWYNCCIYPQISLFVLQFRIESNQRVSEFEATYNCIFNCEPSV